MDAQKISPEVRRAVPTAGKNFSDLSPAISIPSSTQALNNNAPCSQLHDAVVAWLAAEKATPSLYFEVYSQLSTAVRGPELQLEHCGLDEKAIQAMPEGIWQALNRLALASDVPVSSAFLPKYMTHVPMGLRAFQDLSFISFPDYRGFQIRLTHMQVRAGTLQISVRGAVHPLEFCARQGSQIAITGSPHGGTVVYNDENGATTSIVEVSSLQASANQPCSLGQLKPMNASASDARHHSGVKPADGFAKPLPALPAIHLPAVVVHQANSITGADSRPLAESLARQQLEDAIDHWLPDSTTAPERLRIKVSLTLAATSANMDLSRIKELETQQVAGMPKAVWSAIGDLACSLGVVTESLTLPKRMPALPAGLWVLPPLSLIKMPRFSGERIDFRAMPAQWNGLCLNLNGTEDLRNVHLYKTTEVRFAGCPPGIQILCYDEENTVISTKKTKRYKQRASSTDVIQPLLQADEVASSFATGSRSNRANLPADSPTLLGNPEALKALEAGFKEMAFYANKLSDAFFKGDSGSIESYATAILRLNLPAADKTSALSARQKDGNPGLSLAFKQGYGLSVQCFTRIILDSTLPLQQKVELLDAKDTQAFSGLYRAVQQYKIQSGQPFIQLILGSALPELNKLQLVAAYSPDGMKPYARAQYNGLDDIVKAFQTGVARSGMSSSAMQHVLSP